MRLMLPLVAISFTTACSTLFGPPAPLSEVLTRTHTCSETLIIRSQNLTPEQVDDACNMLGAQEARFHSLFGTLKSPVADDNNLSMRANVYQSRDDYIHYVTAHFNVPNDNGGMYLEGHPDQVGNQAEFVAYQRNGEVWNLGHEYVHYLDGRFNLYGSFCDSLHDSHSAPEYCPFPTPAYPHLVWWSEGIAEYIVKGDKNDEAVKIGQSGDYPLSELFNTSYEHNGGTDRVYLWGYLAVRFMMEQHKPLIDQMLSLTRQGDYASYQALVRSWGTQYDGEFTKWINGLPL